MVRGFAQNFSLHILLDLPQHLRAVLQCVLDEVFQSWWQILQIVIEVRRGSRADTEQGERQHAQLEE